MTRSSALHQGAVPADQCSSKRLEQAPRRPSYFQLPETQIATSPELRGLSLQFARDSLLELFLQSCNSRDESQPARKETHENGNGVLAAFIIAEAASHVSLASTTHS